MADDPCFLTKETFILKVPKKSPLMLRMIVLVFAMVCGVFICSVCLKQISTRSKVGFLKVQVIDMPCSKPNIDPSDVPYVHYPKPITYSRAECACHPVRYFAILSMQRSGSGWFETLLNNHTNISSNGEIFSVKVRRSNISTIVETLDKVYNLDWFSSASKNECTAAVGLKWMLNQGLMQYHVEIVDYFKRRGVSAIFLFRRNLLRRMISVLANSYDRDAKLLNGTHKSHVHSHHEVFLFYVMKYLLFLFSLISLRNLSNTLKNIKRVIERSQLVIELFQADILAKYKPVINATLLIPNLRQVEETTAKALEYFNSTRHIVLYYEDVVRNRTKLRDVQDFLRVPQRELKSRQVKIHRGPLSNQIENWEDVQKALRGSQYESFLHADYRK